MELGGDFGYYRIVAPGDPWMTRRYERWEDAEAILKILDQPGYEIVAFTKSGKRMAAPERSKGSE